VLNVGGSKYSAIIDTGFNGDLELPENLRSAVNARLFCQAKSHLAAGVVVEEELYLVDFPFEGRNIRSHATFVDGDEILIGTHLLKDYRLSINFVARSVRLQRI
jgi:clan AA aspartic protease